MSIYIKPRGITYIYSRPMELRPSPTDDFDLYGGFNEDADEAFIYPAQVTHLIRRAAHCG